SEVGSHHKQKRRPGGPGRRMSNRPVLPSLVLPRSGGTVGDDWPVTLSAWLTQAPVTRYSTVALRVASAPPRVNRGSRAEEAAPHGDGRTSHNTREVAVDSSGSF